MMDKDLEKTLFKIEQSIKSVEYTLKDILKELEFSNEDKREIKRRHEKLNRH